MTRPAQHCCHANSGITHDGPPAWPINGGPLRAERRPKAATPPTSRPKTEPAPRSRLATSLEEDAPLRRQDAVRLQRSPDERRHCSHAYHDEAYVTKMKPRYQPPTRSWAVGPACCQGVGSRRDPPAGGPQQPAQKPASAVTDGWAPRPAGLPLYPQGVGLYKPPGAPMQGVGL